MREINSYDDYVLHLAAISNPYRQKSDFYAVSVLGENLLEALTICSSHLKKYLFLGATVYGANVSGKMAEHTELHPTGHYSISKVAMESICRKYFQHLLSSLLGL